MIVDAPAKVNLVLEVLSRRPDGFHEIRSLLTTIDLCDRLRIEEAPPGRIHIRCDAPQVPTGPDNLVHRAARALWERMGRRPGCWIEIQKRIPVGGGLGGGSSDAAAALKALNRLWGADLSTEQLAEVGAGIGSDVPFFFWPGRAIVSGRGDCVRPVRMKWTGWIALVMAGMEVSTRKVYACHRVRIPKNPEGDVAELLEMESAAALRPCLRNALEEAVFAVAPGVGRLREALVETGAASIRVSGAGSVLFELFDEEGEARDFAMRARSCKFTRAAIVVRTPASCE